MLWEVIWGLKARSEGAENCKVFAGINSGVSQPPHEVGTLFPVAYQKTEAQSQRRPIVPVSLNFRDVAAPSVEREMQNPKGRLQISIRAAIWADSKGKKELQNSIRL